MTPLKLPAPACSHCRACGAPVYFEKTARGETIPVDRDPVDGGTIEMRNGVAVFVPGAALPLFNEPRYTDHRATCTKRTYESSDASSKRAYVKSQGQTRGHTCHWPGCDKQVPPALWGCKTHWFSLPKGLRDRIWATYAPGQEKTMSPSSEYVDAAHAVEEWIEKVGRHRA